MRIHTRLGLSVCLTVFSLVSIVLLLPRSRVGTQLQKIALATSIDHYWDWAANEEGLDGGVRLVVFGDSWVDNSVEDGEEGKGRSWTEELCDEINCSSYLNFGTSQPAKSYPESPPTGAVTSNQVYESAAKGNGPDSPVLSALPDLAAQVEEFLSLPPPETQPTETFFVVSFGIWDIYHLASLDFFRGQKAVADTIPEIFAQLDKLYAHHANGGRGVGNPTTTTTTKPAGSAKEEEVKNKHTPPFRVIIPKLFDPTLLPGWLSQRPVPLRPSSVAEQQKNGMYLTALWNAILENKIGEWLEKASASASASASAGKDEAEPGPTEGQQDELYKPTPETPETPETTSSSPAIVERDVYFYDLPRYLLDIIVEHDLEVAGVSDAKGLGKGESPFEKVYQPCVLDAGSGAEEGYVEVGGQLVCKRPKEYLFWDSFNLGSVASEGIGKEVGEMVRKGESMKSILEGEKGFWGTG